ERGPLALGRVGLHRSVTPRTRARPAGWADAPEHVADATGRAAGIAQTTGPLRPHREANDPVLPATGARKGAHQRQGRRVPGEPLSALRARPLRARPGLGYYG